MRKILLLLCVLILFSGCENFLNINPDSEVVNDDMFNTAEGVEDALYGVYMSMVKEDMYGGNMSVLIPEILAQNFVTGEEIYQEMSCLNYDNTYSKNSSKSIWSESYLVISYLNNIIENLDHKNEKDFRYYKLYRGEALGLRAAIHFDILRLFAVQMTSADENAKKKAIPYVTKYTFKVTPFSSVEEVYDKIIVDLKEAETCLMEDESLMPAVRKGNEKGFTGARELHFNYYAAQAMLARVYWMKGDLKNAKLYADKVIQSGKFIFAAKGMLSTFMKRRVSLSETIWGLYTINIGSFLYDKQLKSNILKLPSTWKELYKVTGGDVGEKDEREKVWFTTKDFEGSLKDVCIKIMDENNDVSPYTGGGYLGFSMIRLPEMYYIMAEALLEEGNAGKARVYLDSVVAVRGLVKFADREFERKITIDDIMNEWRKEFYGEGIWWYCLKRKNKDIFVHERNTIVAGSDKIYTLPIPADEFESRDD